MKILRCLVISVLVTAILLSGVEIFAAEIVATPDNYNGTVSIEAVDVVNKRDIPVTIKILNPDVIYADVLSGATSLQNAAAYIGEVYSEREGDSVVVQIPSIVMPTNSIKGTYKVIVSVDGSRNFETEFSYTNFKKIKEIFTSINGISETDTNFDSTVNALIINNDKILGISVDEYATLVGTTAQNVVHKELKKHTFATSEADIAGALANFKSVFEESSAFAALLNHTDLTKIENNLKKYSALYAIDFTEYDKLELSNKQKVLTRIMNTDFNDMQQVAGIFNEQVILEKISVAAYGEIYSLITSNNGLLNVPLDYMNIISDHNKDSIFIDMIGKSYNNKSELTTVFKASVDKVYILQLNANNQNTGSPITGGGGFSGVVDWNTPETFDDIKDVAWAKDAIEYLKKNNIIAGKGDNKFAPNDNATRAEFVKMAVELFVKDIGSTSSQFSDVSKDDWFYDYINKGVSAGIISGVGDGLFNPYDNITRQDIAVILDRAVKKGMLSGNLTFLDRGDISDYAVEAVGRLNHAGVILGDNNNCFNPQNYATRAEVAVMLYRMHLLD